MLRHLRLATKEEIEQVRSGSDFSPRCTVLAMDQNEGEPDLAVVKEVVFLNPVYFGKKTNDIQKAKFLWGVEERMAGGGVQVYYTLVPAKDERYRNVMKGWGYKELSTEPEVLLKKELT